MNSKDTFQIICSFLEPTQLVYLRRLCKVYNLWTDNYIIKTYKSINLQDKACPKCGNWISNEDISNYNEFYDYFLMDDLKNSRFEQIEEWFNQNYIFDIERKSLLCEDCDIEEDYSNYFYFRYKGTRNYTLVSFYSLYSWCALSIVDNKDNKKGYWNEYRKILSCTYEEMIKSEGFYENSWDSWDENELEGDEDY